jgi:glycosyltransferase involved in cell wall biosynthesis
MDISVVVPFYKGNQHMEQLFGVMRRNAAAAGKLQVELILVNDSPEVPVVYEPGWVEGFTLRILDNPHNMGIHGSRINGIRGAQGTFVQMLDQDDLLADDALLSQYEAIGDHDIVVCNGEDQGGPHPGVLYSSVSQQRMVAELSYYYTIGCMITSPGQCLIRKSAFPACWLAEPIRNNGSDDLLLWLLMLNDGSRWTINPRNLYTHVITGSNLSADFYRIRTSAFEVKDFMKSHGLLTEKQERQFLRRFRMREEYECKGKQRKLWAMICNPDLSWDLLIKKIRGKMR